MGRFRRFASWRPRSSAVRAWPPRRTAMAIGARKRIIQDGLKFAGLGGRFLRLQGRGRLDPRSAAHGLGRPSERA
jgi:hypothetical protein